MSRVCLLLLVAFLVPLFGCDKAREESTEDYTEFVDPFIGTGGHGHTYPGASVPFGMVQLSPDTRLDGWDGCSAYHYSDSVVYGFSHTHLSGTGCSDYGDILFMPVLNYFPFSDTIIDKNGYWYKAAFSHEKEKASPASYSVLLNNGTNVELTATKRVGFHKYHYNQDGQPGVVVDLKHRDIVLESSFRIINDTLIQGYRRSKAWATDQYVYFAASFSSPVSECKIALNDTIIESADEVSGENVKAYLAFDLPADRELYVNVGISAVDEEGALNNLRTESKEKTFADVLTDSRKSWNDVFNKIQVEGGTDEQKTVFYTALYHSFLSPNLFMDADGRYRGTDLKIHNADGFENYSVFSLWDTYRATHPLFALIEKKKTREFIRTFLAQYENGGQLPVWELAANYTGCMIGYHAVPVILDAYTKGVTDFDGEFALEAMLNSAEKNHLGLESYRKYGYIPADKEHESVSKTLEYAYDDWCIAQMADILGNQEVYGTYIKRAQFYKNIFDSESGFMRAKMNGAWWHPFDPKEVNFNYTEANSWQYTFYVPQDVSGLMTLMGGQEELSKKLDVLFMESEQTTGRTQADITGLIGQYAHGNEPSHHMAYLYNYVGQPWKTQTRVREIMDNLYSHAPDGLCGNEDCGQMSSWFVFSAMGFYPVTPGMDYYAIGTPLFPEVRINLENGKTFTVKAENLSAENKYIQSATINGGDLSRSFIKYTEINDGGELIFKMGSQPNEKLWREEKSRPVSSISNEAMAAAPFHKSHLKTFYDSMLIELNSHTEGASIYYTLDNKEPDSSSLLYTEPFYIDSSLVLKAIAVKEGMINSYTMDADFLQIPKGRSVVIQSKYNPQYTAGGDIGLIDYIRGGNDFRTGSWQGYQGQDFSATVNLGKTQKVKRIGAGFLQDTRSWIVMPKTISFSVSKNGKDFTQVGKLFSEVDPGNYDVVVKDYMLEGLDLDVQFVRVDAQWFGVLPDWHLGAGGESFIFVDEIIVE